jgi:hypothetical protein
MERLPGVMLLKFGMIGGENFGKQLSLFCSSLTPSYLVAISRWDILIDTQASFPYTFPVRKRVIINFK